MDHHRELFKQSQIKIDPKKKETATDLKVDVLNGGRVHAIFEL